MKLFRRFWQEGRDTMMVEGFCDAWDGGLYKMRFMPGHAGPYHYAIDLVTAKGTQNFSGRFFVKESKRKGPLRIDLQHPSHFIYENTDEHFFWNGTTACWMLGWKDEQIIRDAIDRFASLGVNRIRVAINGRAHGGDRWSEPTVVESEKFTFKLNPWVAARPDDLDHPAFDVSRFNVPHWLTSQASWTKRK